MKKVMFALVLMFIALDGYSQLGFGFGMGGFGMGMRVPLNSNNGARRSHTIENHVQQMKSDLNLDKDQVVKVRSLLVERDRRQQGPNPMMGKEYNERMQQILSPEQYSRLTELRQQKRSQKKPQNQPPNNGDNKGPHPEDWDD